MIVTKVRNEVFFKVAESQKGAKINLDDGIVFSLATNSPYRNQQNNNLRAMFSREQEAMPNCLRNHSDSILNSDEATAIIALYFAMETPARIQFARYIPVLQIFHSRQRDITYNSIINMVDTLDRYTETEVPRNAFYNYIIGRDGLDLSYTYWHDRVKEFQVVNSGVDLTDLTERQERIMHDLIRHKVSAEKLTYIKRKLQTEHIEYLVDGSDVRHFFNLSEKLELPFNHKNFLNGYANMKYEYEMQKETMMAKTVAKKQADIFKLDTEEYYCVMPKTIKEFQDMGRKMNNCIGSYYSRVADGDSTIVFIYDKKNDEPIANVEVVPDYANGFRIACFLGYSNNRHVNMRMGNYYQNYQNHIGSIHIEV